MQHQLKVLYIHGGGSNQSKSYKAQYLAQHFESLCPEMVSTTMYDNCKNQQLQALVDFQPDVVAGASFGGALLLDLIRNKHWRGPSVVMCPALLPGLDDFTLPTTVPIILIHGTDDKVVRMEISKKLLEHNQNPDNIIFHPIESAGHNLEPITNDESLAQWVEQAYSMRNDVAGYEGDDSRIDVPKNAGTKSNDTKKRCIIS